MWGNKGLVLEGLGKNEEAIMCYNRVIELDPNDSKAWVSKGWNLNVLGRFEEAIRCLEKARELDPTYTDTSTLIESIKRKMGLKKQ